MRGFSLVEALLVVSIIGLIGVVVVPSIQDAPNAAKKTKLEQDVVIVNNAIEAYLVAGGSQGALNPSSVIEALKQRVLGGPTAEMTGPLGPFLDPRVRTNRTDFAWSARFVTSPRPRFVVERSSNGVVFSKGLPSPVGGPVASGGPSWLWSYSPGAPTQVDRPVFQPGTVDSGTALGTTNTVLAGLNCPEILPAGQTYELSSFPLTVELDESVNPPGSSIAFYRIGTVEVPDSGSWVRWVGLPFTVNPDSVVTAIAVSIDPSRYYNSPACSETYDVNPLQLVVQVTPRTGVTYAQAGGQMVGQAQLAPVTATISLANLSSIPPPYLSSSLFAVRFTTDGSDPSASASSEIGPNFSGSFAPVEVPLGLSLWGGNSTITIKAVAVSLKPAWFTTSAVVDGDNTRVTTPLGLNVVPANPVGLPVRVLVNETGVVPQGLRKFFTVNGANPLSAASGGIPLQPPASLYNDATPPVAASLPTSTYTFTAQATGPAGFESWFSSAPTAQNYRVVTTLLSEFVGANVSGGAIKGRVFGSIFVSAPASLGVLNADFQINGGNLYLPGLPGIELPGGGGNQTIRVVGEGDPVPATLNISPTRIAGKEYTADGELAVPQLDTRQIVDLGGSGVPDNYTVKMTTSGFIEGKIYRNVDVPPPPPVPTVPAGLPVYTNSISGTFTNSIPSGVYSNRITMNSTGSVLRLGTPGSVSQYVFSGNTWNKGAVEILGPVEIFFLDGFVNRGVVFGGPENVAPSSATSLRINVMTNTVDLSGGASVYSSLWAGGSDVKVGNGSSLYGSVYAYEMEIAPGGVMDVR